MAKNSSDEAPEGKGGRGAGYGVPGPDSPMHDRIRHAITLAGGDKRVYERCGVSVRNLQNYKSGGAKPNAETIGRIAKGTGVSLLWLVYGQGPMRAGLAEQQSPYSAAGAPLLDEQALDERPLDERTLIDTIVVVEEVLTEAGLTPSPQAKAEKVLEIYKATMAAKASGETLSPVRILRMVRERDEET
ncbi:helix-turn-helix domain-containing protein [Pelagibius sp.]|uniref:helix-turn-helix domain-containing protein n=1 Tax=Pelagibius sp. TaxID=1931238 RepID=UPI003B5084D0